MTTRREFLKTAAIVTAASMAGAVGAPKFAFGQNAAGKTFIKVFMRGGADGLHLFPMYGDLAYFQYRPNIAIEAPSNDRNSAIDMGHPDQLRGLNPNLEALMEIWETGNMMVSPSTSLPEGNRSHFDCQRWIGTGARNNFIDGYLNRYLQNIPGEHPLRGVVAGKSSISTEARGAFPVAAIRDGGSFQLRNGDFCSGDGCADNQLTEIMREISSHEVDLSAVEGAVRESQLIMLDAIAEVQAAGMDYSPSAGGLDYSNSDLGRGLRLCAQLLKAGVPLETAALDWNIGWDTHSNQISESANPIADDDKRYHQRMRTGATDFVTFWRDMGPAMRDVVVLVGTEFGRTKKENGNLGTDHGDGGAWFAFGGPTVRGFAQDVDTIADEVIGNRNRLPNVVNYRDIVGEIMVRHMGMSQQLISTVFPNHTFDNNNLFTAMS